MDGITVAIAAAPKGLTLHTELRLIKASLLYADKIVLVSPVALLLDNVAALAEASSEQRITVFQHMAPLIGQQEEAAKLGRILKSIETVTDEKERVIQKMRFDNQMNKGWAPIRAKLDEALDSAGMQELVHAVGEGIVEVSSLDDAGPDSDEIVQAFTRHIAAMLTTDDAYPLFDDFSADVAAALVREGKIDPATHQARRGARADTAASFVSRLPSFDTATVAELIDVRNSLGSSLQMFRAAIHEIGESFASAPFSPDLQLEIDDAWREVVAPALLELETEMNDNQLLQSIGRRSATSGSAGAAAALVLGSFAMQSMPDILAMTGAAPPIIAAVFDELDRRSELRGSRWFLLHTTEQRLAG